MSEENEALHRRFFDELINKGRPEAIDELLDPDWEGSHRRPPTGRPGRLQAAVRRVPGRLLGIQGHHRAPDLRGRHGGHPHHAEREEHRRVHGNGADQRDVHYPGIEIVRMENGRIREFWGLLDIMVMLQQLGVVPAQPPG